MIITISGRAGSGKSTIGKLLAKKLKLKHYSMGDLLRELAKEKGMGIMELSKLAEKDESIDRELDEKQKKLGKEQDDFVIDGRLSSLFIPKATLKVFLDATEEVRGKRIFGDKRKDERNTDLDKTIKNIRAREESENKRYKQLYKYDCYDKKNYDLVIDTSSKTVAEVVQLICKEM